MPTGTQIVIGFFPGTQSPVDERYLNEGVAWADEAAVLAGIAIGSRHPYMTVNIAGVEYWFSADMTTLSIKTASTGQTAAETSIADTGTLYDATDVEAALAEVMAYAVALEATIPDPATVNQTVFTINLGTGDLAAKVAAWDGLPTGWDIDITSGVNLLITHTLTGRKLAGVNIFEIDGSDERLLVPFSSAFTGVLCNGLTVLIEGLAPTALAIRIELIFK